MCFKPKAPKPAKDLTPIHDEAEQTAESGTGVGGVGVVSGGGGTATVREGGSVDDNTRRRRRSASAGLGL